MATNYWLMKSEPESFSIEDLKAAPHQTTFWDGVRNYQARNFMWQEMRVGDRCFFYHSNAKPPGIVGIVKVAKQAYPDPTQFDTQSKYYDAKASLEKPRWYAVEVKLERIFKQLLSLDQLKSYPELEGMTLLKKGSRLSIQPVSKAHWDFVTKKLS